MNEREQPACGEEAEETVEQMLENLWGASAPPVPPYIDETVRGYIKHAIKSGLADGLSKQTLLMIVEFWLSPEPEDLPAATEKENV